MAILDRCTCDYHGPAHCDSHRSGESKMVAHTVGMLPRGVCYDPSRTVTGVVVQGRHIRLPNGYVQTLQER